MCLGAHCLRRSQVPTWFSVEHSVSWAKRCLERHFPWKRAWLSRPGTCKKARLSCSTAFVYGLYCPGTRIQMLDPQGVFLRSSTWYRGRHNKFHFSFASRELHLTKDPQIYNESWALRIKIWECQSWWFQHKRGRGRWISRFVGSTVNYTVKKGKLHCLQKEKKKLKQKNKWRWENKNKIGGWRDSFILVKAEYFQFPTILVLKTILLLLT